VSVAVSKDRRFHRAHVKPARRRRPWRGFAVWLAKYTAVATFAAIVVYRGGDVVAQARMLQIDRVVIRGNTRLSTGEVLALLNGLRGENLVWADLGAWRRRLLASPWVRDATLRRSLPSTVEVVVAEREAIGIGRVNGALYLVDDRGAVIDEYGPHYGDLDLPVIDGLAGPHAPAALGDDPHADLAARLLVAARAKPPVLQRISQVDVRDAHNAAVILTGDPAVLYVGEERFAERLESYLDLAPALRGQVTNIDNVDLRFDNRMYVRPASAASSLRRGKADDATSTLRRGKPDAATSTLRHGESDDATSSLRRGKPDGATSTQRRAKPDDTASTHRQLDDTASRTRDASPSGEQQRPAAGAVGSGQR
jgi:cell division protein FtsQ